MDMPTFGGRCCLLPSSSPPPPITQTYVIYIAIVIVKMARHAGSRATFQRPLPNVQWHVHLSTDGSILRAMFPLLFLNKSWAGFQYIITFSLLLSLSIFTFLPINYVLETNCICKQIVFVELLMASLSGRSSNKARVDPPLRVAPLKTDTGPNTLWYSSWTQDGWRRNAR